MYNYIHNIGLDNLQHEQMLEDSWWLCRPFPGLYYFFEIFKYSKFLPF